MGYGSGLRKTYDLYKDLVLRDNISLRAFFINCFAAIFDSEFVKENVRNA